MKDGRGKKVNEGGRRGLNAKVHESNANTVVTITYG